MGSASYMAGPISATRWSSRLIARNRWCLSGYLWPKLPSRSPDYVREACRAAGLRDRSAHGLRKAAATRAANAGATVAQLEAIFGWNGGRMASLYTRAADRRQLARRAMHKLANDERTSIPSPLGKTPSPSENNQ